MEKKILYGVAMILILGLGISYILLDEWRYSEKEADQITEPLSGKEVPLITINESDESDPSKNTIIKIGEPTISLMSNKTAAERANAYVMRFIADEREKYLFAENLDSATTTEQQNIASTFSLVPTVLLNTPKYITFRFMESRLFKHAQKTEQSIKYIIFDIERGAPVSATELFKDNLALSTIAQKFSALGGARLDHTNNEMAQLLQSKYALGISSAGLHLSLNANTQGTNQDNTSGITLPLATIANELREEVHLAIANEDKNIRMSEPLYENTP
jgi:hypothetical protein